ncbi:MAG: MBL fold metallo-hydrolase [Ktedonobacterales bacterium]
MRVISLGSGSGGNALLVEAGSTRVLLDAGFPPRTLNARLRQVGVEPHTLTAVLLTHEHHDHACGAVAFARLHSIPLVADPRTLGAVLEVPGALRDGGPPARQELPAGRDLRLGALEVRSFPISHDAVAPCGYHLSSGAWSVCFATDTGVVGRPMAEALQAANLLVIESNHDVSLLESGPYPHYLKRRIRSATGHLSNVQAAEALALALDDGPRWVWLAHLSRTNNTPDHARLTVRQHLQRAGLGHALVQVVPPQIGPIWDSSRLWTDHGRPPADALPAPAHMAGPPSREPAEVPASSPRLARHIGPEAAE